MDVGTQKTNDMLPLDSGVQPSPIAAQTHYNLHVQGAVDDFRRSVEITRDVRFQANLRLARRQRASSYCVSLLSLYVIGLSLLPNILSLAQYQNQILLGCSIVLSVFVIFTSLIDGSQNFYHQGELLHQCARRIAFISYRLKNIDVKNNPAEAMSQLEDLQEEYRKALDECPTNHENADFYREVYQKPHLFPKHYPGTLKFFHKLYYRALTWLMSYFWLFMPVSACVVITVIVFLYVIRGSGPLLK